MTYKPLPDWLYAMSYGYDEVLMEGPRYAVVRCPGGTYASGQERSYGAVKFVAVEKTQDGKGYELHRTGTTLQHGGRIKAGMRKRWQALVQGEDETIFKLQLAEILALNPDLA